MRSMTGYGRGQSLHQGVVVILELTAVNRKQQDIRLTLPKELLCLEPRLRARVAERLSRGAVAVALTYELTAERRLAAAQVDAEFAVALVERFRALATRLGINSEIRLGELLAVPGVVQDAQSLLPLDDIADAAVLALDAALAALRNMQETEGDNLRRDLLLRSRSLEPRAAELAAGQDAILAHYRDRLKERMVQLGLNPVADAERLAREAALLAERADIHEETTRLASHLQQFRALLETPPDEPAGRNLDFLCQELGREINTLAAKTCDTAHSRLALAFKTELERLREQVQNIE